MLNMNTAMYKDVFHEAFDAFCKEKNISYDGPTGKNTPDGNVILYELANFSMGYKIITLILDKQGVLMGISLRGVKLRSAVSNLNGFFFSVPAVIILVDDDHLHQQVILRVDERKLKEFKASIYGYSRGSNGMVMGFGVIPPMLLSESIFQTKQDALEFVKKAKQTDGWEVMYCQINGENL